MFFNNWSSNAWDPNEAYLIVSLRLFILDNTKDYLTNTSWSMWGMSLVYFSFCFVNVYWGHEYIDRLLMCFLPNHVLAIISPKSHIDIIYILLEICLVVSSYDRKICTFYSIICLTNKGFPLFPRLQRNFRIFRNLNMIASFYNLCTLPTHWGSSNNHEIRLCAI